MGLPASKETFKQKESKLKAATKKRKSATSRNVVNFLEAQSKRKEQALTEDEKAALVIEFRTKARKLARSILRKWHSRLDLQEVDSVVDLSLCEAVRRFDPTKGASFMTFLYYHLRGNLIRTVSSAANANGYIADEDKEYANDKGYAARAINAIEVAEALSGSEVTTPDEVLFKKELIALSLDACKRLDDLEREVIERLFLGEEQLMDIAHSLGYSRCHISRVKKKALIALQAELNQSLGTESTEGVKTVAERRPIHRRRPRSAQAQAAARRRPTLLDDEPLAVNG